MATTRSTTAGPTTEQTLEIIRRLDAPPSLIFRAWTEPERAKQWWGPKGFTCPVCEIDLRPGGVYLNCMHAPDGKDYWSTGVYREIDEPERIVCSDCFADEHGNRVPPKHYGMSADWPAEAMIEVAFTRKAGKTRLTLHHWPIKPGPERDMCERGWNEMLDKLVDYLTQA